MAERDFFGGQKEALEANGNVLVSASAGSGKTTVLTERIARLVAAGQDVRRIAVMTFSKAAAAEMKSRIVKKLYDLMRGGSHPEIYKQLEAFPFANIGTIDSFCYSLVKKYFAVVGADPAAIPMEPDESVRVFDECVDLVIKERIEDDDADFIAFCERYAGTRKMDDVKTLIKDLRTFLSVQVDPDAVLALPTKRLCEEYFLNCAKRRVGYLVKKVTGVRRVGEKIGDVQEGVGSRIENNAVALQNALSSCEEFFRALSFCEKEKKLGNKRNDKFGVPIEPFEKELYNEAVAAYGDFLEAMQKFSEVYFDEFGKKYGEKDAAILIDLTERTEKKYAERKRRGGKIDFADMARLASKILDDEGVRREVKGSFDYVFVDEYQDTNYLQEALFSKISNGNNVYAVGDVKQSIYHFRFAEPQIFTDRMEDFSVKKTGTNVHMNENFRSHPAVLNFVNEVCSAVMTTEFCRIDYRNDDYMRAYEGESYPPDEDAVRLYLYDKAEKKYAEPGVYSVREGEKEGDDDPELNLLCDLIAREVGAELVGKKGEKKTIAYSDIAVLVPTNKRCREIAEALKKRGIPATVGDGDKGLYAPRELLVDFLRLSVSTEDVSVVNAALSGLFGLTKEDLLSVRANCPEKSFFECLKEYNGEPKIAKKVSALLSYVEELKDIGRVRKASELMQKVLSDGLDGVILSYGAEASKRVRRFVADVQRMECDVDVNDFLEYYDAGYEGDRPVGRADSVTVMTTHKSKGLEFPVVLVASLAAEQAGKNVDSKKLYLDCDLGVALKSADFETGNSAHNFLTKVFALKSVAEEREEMARCAYVAFTRAKNRLILVGKKTNPCTEIDKAKSFLDLITYAASENPAINGYNRYDFPTRIEATEAETEESGEEDFSELDWSYDYESATRLSAKTTVSELLEKEEFVPKPYFYGGGRREEDAAKVGTAYHLVLQKIDFDADEGKVEDFLQEAVKNGEIEENIAKKLSVKKIVDLLGCEVMLRAKGNETLREQPFVLPIEREGEITLVQGVTDLLIFEEDGVTVVDYKASAKDPDSLAKTYEKQLDLYAKAAESVFSVKVKEKILLNLLRGYQVSV